LIGYWKLLLIFFEFISFEGDIYTIVFAPIIYEFITFYPTILDGSYLIYGGRSYSIIYYFIILCFLG